MLGCKRVYGGKHRRDNGLLVMFLEEILTVKAVVLSGDPRNRGEAVALAS
jgi:hypothetical protein